MFGESFCCEVVRLRAFHSALLLALCDHVGGLKTTSVSLFLYFLLLVLHAASLVSLLA